MGLQCNLTVHAPRVTERSPTLKLFEPLRFALLWRLFYTDKNVHSGKQPACRSGDSRGKGLIPALGRSPGVGNGNLLQYSCLENSTDRGTWQASQRGHKSTGTEHACTHTHTHTHKNGYITGHWYLNSASNLSPLSTGQGVPSNLPTTWVVPLATASYP